MTSRLLAGPAVAAAAFAALTAGHQPARQVAMREIVHIQAVPAPVGPVPATGGTIIVEN
jgi:hypothetical protein